MSETDHRDNLNLPTAPLTNHEKRSHATDGVAQDDLKNADANSEIDTLPEDMIPESVDPGALPEAKGDDAQTDAAVEDILRSDADTMLPHEAARPAVQKPNRRDRLRKAMKRWWKSPWKRYGTLLGLLLLVGTLFFVPAVKAYVFNAVGVRSSATIVVIDGASTLPLQNAVVSIDGVSAKTDEDGTARLRGIRLGRHRVEVRKSAFTTYAKNVDFGVNIVDLGEVTLRPAGTSLSFTFVDYLTGKPVADVSLKVGEATAKSNKAGKAVLTTKPGTVGDVMVTKEGYRTESVQVPEADTYSTMMKLVVARRAVFISREGGKYDVYKMYVDGKDKTVLLAGTGLETQMMSVLPSPDGTIAAVVSQRDDKRNKDGYVLNALTMVNIETNERTNLEYAEQITPLGWHDTTFVYKQTVADASAANKNRQKIIAYTIKNNSRFQLATANYFAGEILVGSTLYYTVSATDPSATETFARVDIDGTNKKTLYTGNVWSLHRTGYSTIKLQTPERWFQYTFGGVAPTETTPENGVAERYYLDSPDGKRSVRVDARDYNGALIVRDLASGKEVELTTQKSMQSPVYWLTDTIVVYRVSSAAEVADYAVDVLGGAPKKLADVSLTNTY